MKFDITFFELSTLEDIDDMSITIEAQNEEAAEDYAFQYLLKTHFEDVQNYGYSVDEAED